MKRIDYVMGCKLLREAGCTTQEVERLSKLRSDYYQEQEREAVSVPQPCQQHSSLLRKVIDKILDMCQTFATSGYLYCMQDQHLF